MGDSGAMISSNGTNARASLACPYCTLNLAGFPAGVKFAPSDQELIEHLESKVLEKEGGGSRAHALINHFIPTIEGDNGICYTHPENLPGVSRDGHIKHFFHRTFKAHPTGTRKRRKIMSESGQHSSEDVGNASWHKTGLTLPVIVRGRQKGCKKIMVLRNKKQGKTETTNWVMHQYQLCMSEEKDGELVVSKVFYRCPDVTMIEQNDEKAGVGDPVSSDQGQVHDNNQHIPSQNLVQSVDPEPDTTLSLGLSTGNVLVGMMIKEASNTTLSSNKEKEGEQENYTANKVSTKMIERTEPEGTLGKAEGNVFCGITQKEGGEDGHDITTAVTKATTVGWMLDNTDNGSTTKLEPGSTGEEAQIDMGKQLGMVLRQLQDILHFARPLVKVQMDAIQGLVELSTMIQKKTGNQREAAETPGLMA